MSRIKDIIEDTGAFDCVECGKCTSLCPVAKVNPEFAPRLIVVKAQAGLEEDLRRDKDIWQCLTCEVCNDMCPYEVDFSGFIQGMRAVAAEYNNLPICSEAGVIHTMQRMTGMGQKQDRLRWLTEDMKVAEEGEVFYFTGCAYQLGILFNDKAEELKETPASVVRILNAAGIVPVVSNDEVCCGHDLIWAGDERSFKKLMERNLEVIERSGAGVVVFSCPECMRTFEIDYQDFVGELDLELKHISKYILELIDEGKLEFEETGIRVTYQDSCRLGRHLGLYDGPREAIGEMGMELIEMPNAREEALCCGVNAFANCSEISREMQIVRMKEAKKTGADMMLSYCPKCVIHYNCLLKSEKLPVDRALVDIPVREFSNVMAEALVDSGETGDGHGISYDEILDSHKPSVATEHKGTSR